MSKKQQQQTKIFFDKIHLDWHKRAIFNKKNHFNTINERNNFALHYFKKLRLKRHLDLGCGSGELINITSKYSKKSVGIDFSNRMISTAKKKYGENIKRTFYSMDIKKYLGENKNKYDLISANGFFEYFSKNEMNDLFKKIKQNLNKNGYLIGSFRNRLFNIFSLNDFSLNELKAKNLNNLLNEAVLLNSPKYKMILNKKIKHNFRLKQITHPQTGGVKVKIRNQYTPIEISTKLLKIGFSIENIYPINLHLINPKIKNHKVIIDLKRKSLKLYNDINFGSLISQSSTFMILAKKIK